MGFGKKQTANLFLVILVTVLAVVFLTSSFIAGVYPARAEGASCSVSWSERPYMEGEQVKIRLALTGLPANAQIAGSVSLSLFGLEDASFVSNESMLETNYNTTSSPAVFRISVSEGAYVTASADGVWEIGEFSVKVSAGGSESRFSAEASLSDAAGTEITITTAAYSITRSAETPTPAPTQTPTPGQSGTPSSGATPTPDTSASPSGSATPDISSMSPSPSESTPEPTQTPEPTDPPATMTVIETAAPSGSGQPSDGSPSDKNTPDAAEGTLLPSVSSQRPGTGGDNTISVGAVVFWSIVALIAGIWIGIGIGAFIWRKKSVFMTPTEKKIIGRF